MSGPTLADLLGEIENNRNASMDRKIASALALREPSLHKSSTRLEQQKEALLTKLRQDLDFMRSHPTEQETRAYLAKLVQRKEVEWYGVRPTDAIEACCVDLYHYGRLQPLFLDPFVTDVWVVGTYGVLYQKAGKVAWYVGDDGGKVHFQSLEEVREWVERKLGKDFHLDLSLPSLDAIFLDGTRLMYRSQAAGFSHFADGTEYRLERNQPLLAIRRFGREWTLEELVASGMLTQPMAEYLVLLPKTRSSVILGGPTGAGKSTLQNVLLGYLPQDELTGILEDTPDARPQGGFFVRYWTQHPNGEDVGEITIAQNLLDAKRSNFRNIVVAEMRDGPTALRAVDVAMMTSGFFSTTTHAVTPKKVIEAFVNLLQSAPERPSERRCYELFATVFHHIVCLEWLPERPPQVTAIAEVLETTETSVSYRTVFERVGDEVRYHGLSERMHRLLQKHHLSVPDALEGGIA